MRYSPTFGEEEFCELRCPPGTEFLEHLDMFVARYGYVEFLRDEKGGIPS
jgi:hypothetical protein